MNPYKMLHNAMKIWPIYMIVAVVVALGYLSGGWPMAWKLPMGIIALIGVAAGTSLAGEFLYDWLENKAEQWERKKRTNFSPLDHD